MPGSSSVSSAFSHVERWIGFPLLSANTIFRGPLFEAAAISSCSGLTVCLPHRSFPPLQLSPQSGRGFYVRAERASLPPRASEILSADSRQLAERGLSPRKIQSVVGCSFHRASISAYRLVLR